jgi:hypothetical protein
MKPDHFRTLAAHVVEIARDGANRPRSFLQDTVKSFRAGFTDMHYCF